MKKWRRKKYLINRSIQFRYMGMIAIFVVFFSAITGWSIYLTTWITIIERIRGEPRLHQILDELFRILLFRSLIVIVAGICVAFIITLFISHRIAGPMFRMRRTLDELGRGVIPRKVTLRKKDEFKELSEALNSVIAKAEEMTEANKEIKRNILKYAEKTPELKEEIEKMQLFEQENTETA